VSRHRIRPEDRVRTLTARGRTQTIAEWADELDCAPLTIVKRLRRGLSDDDAVGPISRATDNELWPGANELRYEDDPMAQAVVRRFGGLTLDQVALCLGLNSHERVRQIEEMAFEKIRLRTTLAERLELMRMVARRHESATTWQALEDL
jgi:hypothetical protein